MRGVVIGLVALGLLAACAPRQQVPAASAPPAASSAALTERSVGSPDVLIFAVSGRCPSLCTDAPAANWDYLSRRGTVEAVAAAFRAKGLSVETHTYSDHLLRRHMSRYSDQPQAGFVQLQDDFERLTRELVTGRRNPSRVVLLAHSHGVNWTHQLARLEPQVPVDLAIDLDGICLLFESDHRASFAQLRAEEPGRTWPFDLARGCDLIGIGRRHYRSKDLTWPNIQLNLEVHSQVPNFLFELTPNVRPDGSRGGIETRTFDDDHGRTSYPDSAAVRWVLARIGELDWRP